MHIAGKFWHPHEKNNILKKKLASGREVFASFRLIFGPLKKKNHQYLPFLIFWVCLCSNKIKHLKLLMMTTLIFLPHCIVKTDSRFIFAPIVKTPAVTAIAGKRKSAAAIIFSLGFGAIILRQQKGTFVVCFGLICKFENVLTV